MHHRPSQEVTARTIFGAALRLVDSSELPKYLDDACGSDVKLREQVNSLLSAINAETGDNPLDAMVAAFGPQQTAGAATSRQLSTDLPVPSEIGLYKLLKEIGHGGFGIVYLAEQSGPVRRKVAVKVVKPGMSSRDVIARFEAERQALAMMDHPHIARVLDGGTTESGLPFFVMEYVNGVSLTDHCQNARLSVEQRLTLFNDICRAVQHAHQRGIIHRDLKPSNVLVTMDDLKPVAKVIDFGIAKALGQSLTDRTISTGQLQMLGTPLYMSPEQARLGGIDIDTRSDVYSLGVILYELLSGTTPFTNEELTNTSFDELRRIICEHDPQRPSVRLATLQAAEHSTTAHRHRRDERNFGEELDWIVMKALEKDRDRRYDSANALSEDIERYLKDDTVRACPPTILYRLRKYAKRHAALLTTTVLVLTTAIIGTGFSLRYARHSALSAEQARTSAALAIEAQSEAEKSASEAMQARQWSNTLLYAADMKLVSDAIASDDVPRASELLRRHIPEPGNPDLRGFEWYYYHKRISVSHEIELALTGWIDDLEVSPDGALLAITAPNGVILIYDTATWMRQRTIASGSGAVDGLAWSPDGQRLAAACADGNVCVWDSTTAELQFTVPAHPEYAAEVVFSPDGGALYSCGDDSVVRKWDARTGEAQFAFSGHEREIGDLAVSPDGRLLATASGDRTFVLWEADTGRRLHLFTTDGSGGRVVSVAFSPDGRLVAGANIYGSVYLMETDTGNCHLLVQLADGVEALTFLDGGRWLATADRGGALQLHSVLQNRDPGGETQPTLGLRWEAHAGRVLSLAATPDAFKLISGGRDGCVRVWAPDPYATRWFAQGKGTLSAFVPAPNHRLYLSGLEISVWDFAQRRPIDAFADVQAPQYWRWLACSRDGRWLAAVQAGNRVVVFDGETFHEAQRWQLDGVIDDRARFAFSPDGKQFAIAHSPRIDHVAVYERDRPGPPRVFPAVQCATLAFSPDGHWLAAEQQNDVLLYPLDHEGKPRILTGTTNTISEMAFTRDGELLASVSHDRMLKVWRHATGEMLFSVVAHRGRAISVDVSPDGRTIATAGDDGQVRLWHTATGQPLGAMPQEPCTAPRLRFTDDGLRLISAGVTPYALVYDASP